MLFRAGEPASGTETATDGTAVRTRLVNRGSMARFSPTRSGWSVPVPLPNLPVLNGLGIAIQAVMGSTATSIGVDPSNAVILTLGN